MRDCKHNLSEYESEKERILLSLSEIDNKIEITKVELNKWHVQLELNSSSDDDSGFECSTNFYEGRDTSIEDNSSTSRVADVLGSQRKISRKRKNAAPTPARKHNLRNLNRIDYNVGSLSKKRRRNKPNLATLPPPSPIPEISDVSGMNWDICVDNDLHIERICLECPLHCKGKEIALE
ncbi:16619_t:CDS:2 [Funneliformis caledonium]|uniref:16619_t:CDS:1 n=1 Tax=Funneliformis caledonium TaxID=1117310 RepID=A0A9N8YN45_9GLOM|nr:16619_t:CDS:2 [Funneliformis caledonium]